MTPEREQDLRDYAAGKVLTPHATIGPGLLREVFGLVDTERERNAKLERVVEASRRALQELDREGGYALAQALAALDGSTVEYEYVNPTPLKIVRTVTVHCRHVGKLPAAKHDLDAP